MSNPRPVAVIGGGLAGLTLGIGLRQRGIPVTVREAGHYPRHRVCGEFISGRGQDVLARLGLRDKLLQAGATEARTAAFFLGSAHSPARSLARPALCLSRYTLDALLAAHLRELGGALREGDRCRETDSTEGVVWASGRRLQSQENGWRWFGLKVHARNAELSADLEMHGIPDGYVGVCRLHGGEVNVCGLFRRRPGTSDSVAARCERLRGPLGSSLHARLGNAVLDEDSFCAVAGLVLSPQRADSRSECALGDALTMIPPVTGNGMSLAFESAELALEPLTAWSLGQLDWPAARQQVARACDTAFAQRLAWARWLQWLMLSSMARTPLGRLLLRSDCLWNTMFARTR